MELIKNTITVGLERPVKLLHVTDTHIGLADDRDDERKHALAGRFLSTDRETYFQEQVDYASRNCDLLVHTGDLIDFVSHANVDWARRALQNDIIFFIAGNHEYSQYVGEAWEDNAYRMNSYMQMGYGLGVPMFFNAREVGGVNIVGIDNSYYRFADWQLWRLKKEAEKGLPPSTIRCLSSPFTTIICPCPAATAPIWWAAMRSICCPTASSGRCSSAPTNPPCG